MHYVRYVVFLAMLVAVAAGVSHAASDPTRATIINGCYDQQSGHLRITNATTETPKPCGTNEVEISWNQDGRAGPAGPPGETGPQGPAGISAGYDLYSPIPVLLGRTPSTVISRTFAPGYYIYNISTVISYGGGAQVDVHCNASGGGNQFLNRWDSVFDGAPATVFGSNMKQFVLNGSFGVMEWQGSATLSLECWASYDGNSLSAARSRLTAVKVTTIN